jgi:hypothetical protein
MKIEAAVNATAELVIDGLNYTLAFPISVIPYAEARTGKLYYQLRMQLCYLAWPQSMAELDEHVAKSRKGKASPNGPSGDAL